MQDVATWKRVLREALRAAMRARQTEAVAALRETLAAIDNAEAADLSVAPAVEHGVIAGGVAGLGAGEVARVVLTADAVTAIVEREIRDRREAATEYTRLGRLDEAARLTRQADVLAATAADVGSDDPSP